MSVISTGQVCFPIRPLRALNRCPARSLRAAALDRVQEGLGMRQILVVANQTLNSDELTTAIRARIEDDSCHFLLLVPPVHRHSPNRPPAFGLTSAERPMDVPNASDELDYEEAERRVDAAVERLRNLGTAIDGIVGDPDPLRAIAAVIARRPVDEIIISTLPTRKSRWLHQDLPRRVKRKFKLPVTVDTRTADDDHAR